MPGHPRIPAVQHPPTPPHPTTAPRWRRPAIWVWPLLPLLLLLGGWLWWAHGHSLHQALVWDLQRGRLLALHAEAPWSLGAGLFGGMALLSVLALPGCSLLALATGLCFGTLLGTLLVVGASTLGATLAFLAARHGWRDAARARWGARLAPVEAALARDGAMFLFSMRLVPVIPYPLINPLMGLTGMALRPFILASLLGMLAGSAVYAHAGSTLGQARVLGDLFSPAVLASLGLLALLPWMGRWLSRWLSPIVRRLMGRRAA